MSKSKSDFVPTRSTSLPTRPHPHLEIIEEEVSKMRTWAASASSHPTATAMNAGIEGLENLYASFEQVLRLPPAKQVVARIADELLDEHVKLLDACDALRDSISKVKELTEDVSSTIRRRGGSLQSIARDVEAYIRFRKNMKKQIGGCLNALKSMEARDCYCFTHKDFDLDLLTMTKVFKNVRTVSIHVFTSLLSFLSMPKSTARYSKWGLVSRAFILKGSAVSDVTARHVNELESVDALMVSLQKSFLYPKDMKLDMVRDAERRLGSLENCMGCLEARVRSIFKCLIQNRVSVLNILT